MPKKCSFRNIGKKEQSRHNTDSSGKYQLRKNLIDRLGVNHPVILDAYCGPGEMWERAYNKSESYLGLDKEQFNDERATIVCDNTRFLRHKGLNVNRFDIYDLDAFRSPAYPLAIICNRLRLRKGQKKGFLLTCGDGFNTKMNSTSPKLLKYLGVSRHGGAKVQWDNRKQILQSLIVKACSEAGGRPKSVELLDKGAGNASLLYISFILISV